MTSDTPITEIRVGLQFVEDVMPVGRLATRDHKTYFEYNRNFINHGIEISPIRLPLKAGVTSFDNHLFEGLPGVFNDSLPDGWGRLLLDRHMRSLGIAPAELTPLDRLAHVGLHGMGALVYEPDHGLDKSISSVNLDGLAAQAQAVLEGLSDAVLKELLDLNGSSAGARPKALIGVNKTQQSIIHGVHDLPEAYEPWIVKFPNHQDGIDAGAIEYVYALMAKEAGIVMPDVHLFHAQNGPGYFAVKRFDRSGKNRFHMHTASGLLHSDFRTPALDYEDLIGLTTILTKDMREVEKMFRLAVFNVLAHNRDDHAKNFSFLMAPNGQWKLSPAYDLTFSSGPRGEQSTMVMGEGRNPSTDHLIKLGETANVSKKHVQEIIEQTRAALARWPELAKTHGVREANISLIRERLTSQHAQARALS